MRSKTSKTPVEQKVQPVNSFNSGVLASKLSGNRLLAKMVEERLAKMHPRNAAERIELFRKARKLRQQLIKDASGQPPLFPN